MKIESDSFGKEKSWLRVGPYNRAAFLKLTDLALDYFGINSTVRKSQMIERIRFISVQMIELCELKMCISLVVLMEQTLVQGLFEILDRGSRVVKPFVDHCLSKIEVCTLLVGQSGGIVR